MSVPADFLRSIEIRAHWCQLWVSPVTYDSRVGRPSRVSLDDPQAARWQCLPKWDQMAFADVQDVRLAADANSYCRSGMAGCLVKDPVLSAYIASGPYRTSSRCGHDCKGSCHHLIRRDLRALLLPACMPLTCWNVAQRCALTRGVQRCCEAITRPPGNGRPPAAWL
jgi:hypothetical protein